MEEMMGTFPIEIDHIPYHIDIASWKARDVTDFSPKTTVPGTGAVYGDLQLYQPIAFTNWQHGFGFLWHEDESGYLNTYGKVDTRHKRAVTLFTDDDGTRTDTDTASGKTSGIMYASDFYTASDVGLRKYDSTDSSWSAVNIQRPTVDAASEMGAVALDTAGEMTLSHTVSAIGSNVILFAHVGLDNQSTSFDTMELKFDCSVAMTKFSESPTGTNPSVHSYFLLDSAIPAESRGVAANIVASFTIDSTATINASMIGLSVLNAQQNDTAGGTWAPVGVKEMYDSAATTLTAEVTTDTGRVNELILNFVAVDETEANADLQYVGSAKGSPTYEIATVQADTGATAITTGGSYRYAVQSQNTLQMKVVADTTLAIAQLAYAVEPADEVGIEFLFENGEYLFAQPDCGRIMKFKDTADVGWTPAGFNTNSNSYSWMEIHGGYIFAGKDLLSDVYFSPAPDLSTLYGSPDDDADSLVAGPGAEGTIGAVSFLEKLSVARPDGLWTMDEVEASTDEFISKRTLNFSNLKFDDNFRDMATWGGSLYFTIQDKQFFQWNGAKLQNITPSRVTNDWEYENYYRFDNFTPFGDWLLFTARSTGILNADTTTTVHTGYSEAIVAWDGVGFHKLTEPIIDGDGTISLITIDPAEQRIWFHVSKTASETTDFIKYQADKDFAFAKYPTTGVHTLTTSRIHAGFRRVDKSMPALHMEVDNLASDRTIKIEFAIDDSTTFYEWTTLNRSGEHDIFLPMNQLTREFKYIRFRFTFTTADSGQTPVLESFALMVMMRPDFKMGYSFDIIGGTNVSAGMHEDDRTGYSIMKDLRRARDSKKPVSLTTPFGDEVHGYLTSLTEEAIEWEPDDYEGGEVNILQLIRCNFVQAVEVEGTEDAVLPTW